MNSSSIEKGGFRHSSLPYCFMKLYNNGSRRPQKGVVALAILVLNAGSSTLKFAAFDDAAETQLASGQVDWTGPAGQAVFTARAGDQADVTEQLGLADHRAALARVLHWLTGPQSGPENRSAVTAVGHRVVHGGTAFRESVRIDSKVKTTLAELTELAPLHNPPALDAIDAAQAVLPGVPHVAVFDTAFFTRLPPSVYVYPLPYEWYTDWGVRRFGFHGISHAYCAGRAAEVLGRSSTGLRLVTCHLGNGCSATAIRSGAAVATTMGFTPLDGLMMGTRAGSVDPGVLTYVQRQRQVSAEQLEDVLNHRSGLLGVSGISSDFRQVEAAARQGNARARLALEIYASRIRAAVGALAVTLGGIDALIFTAGVGENSASLRATVCGGMECLGLDLDGHRNDGCRPDTDIAMAGSAARILVLHTREELMIARETTQLRA
jgi:acetate kinase